MQVIAFDVNETLLDVGALDPLFDRAFGSAGLRSQWFALMLQLSFVGGITGDYVDFGAAQAAALGMLEEREHRSLPAEDRQAILEGMASLPPHPDVLEALRRLRREGSFRLVAFTNSVESVAEAQLRAAGVRDQFDAVVSADAVRQLKPAAAAYQHLAAVTEVPVDQVRLVAAHHWDIAGALAAGCRAAFVARPGAVLPSYAVRPDIVGPDVAVVVDRILATDLPA